MLSLDEQQEFLREFLGKMIVDLLNDNPSIRPLVLSLSLIDLAVMYATQQGATLAMIQTRVEQALEVHQARVRQKGPAS